MRIRSLDARNNSVEVEALDNGFIVAYSGRADDCWINGKVFCEELSDVNSVLQEYFSIEQD